MPGFRRMIKNSIFVTTCLLLFSTGLFVASLEPGYLDFDNLPDTNFSCVGKVIGGYYADLETNCQMFHVCTIGQLEEPMDIRFLCLNGTVFDQETRVCERIDEVDCSKSEKFYSLNLELYGNTQPSILEENSETDSPIVSSTSTTTTTTPRTIQTTTTKPTTTSTTRQPQFYSSSIRPITHIPYHKGHSHFSIGNQHSSFTPEEINLNLNSGASSSRTKNYPSHYHHFSDNVNNDKKLVNKFNSEHGSSSTTENSDNNENYKSNIQTSSRPPENYQYNFNYHDIDAEDYNNAPRPHNYQYHSNLANFRPPGISGHSYSNNPYRSSSTHRTNIEYLPAATRKNFDVAQTSTARSFFLQPIKSPSHHYFSHTEKPAQKPQLPVPVLPTLSPIMFSSPAPFSLSRNIENIKRFTDNADDHDLPPRIIISASASVSDASGRTLNYSLGTIGAAKILAQPPSSYDDYKEHDVVLDPFYHDVPKVSKKRGKREAKPIKSKRSPQKINPLDVIQSEDEAIEVLKFLFDWYKNHEQTTSKPTTISIPVSPDVITNINNEFSRNPYSYNEAPRNENSFYQLRPITEPTNFYNSFRSSQQRNHNYNHNKPNRGRHRFTLPYTSTERHTAAEYQNVNYEHSTARVDNFPPRQIVENYVMQPKKPKNVDYLDDLELNRQESKKTSSQIEQKSTERYAQIDTYDYVNDNYEPLTYSNNEHPKEDNSEEQIQTTSNYDHSKLLTPFVNKETTSNEDNHTIATTINYNTIEGNITPSGFQKFEQKTEVEESTPRNVWSTETNQADFTNNFETTTIQSTEKYEEYNVLEKDTNQINAEVTTPSTKSVEETTTFNYDQVYTSRMLEKLEEKPIIKSINANFQPAQYIPFGFEYNEVKETTQIPQTTSKPIQVAADVTLNSLPTESSTKFRTRGRFRNYEYTSREASTTPISTRNWYNTRRRNKERNWRNTQKSYEPYPEITTPTSFFITNPPLTQTSLTTTASLENSNEELENYDTSTSPPSTIIFIIKSKNSSTENTEIYDTTSDVTTQSSPTLKDIDRMFTDFEFSTTTPRNEDKVTDETSTEPSGNSDTTNTETTTEPTGKSESMKTEITKTYATEQFINEIETTTNSVEVTKYSQEKIREMIEKIEENTNGTVVSSQTEMIPEENEETTTIIPTTILESTTITQGENETLTTTPVPSSTSPLTLIEVNTKITEGNSNENELNYKNDELSYRDGRYNRHRTHQRLPKKSRPTPGFRKFSSRHRFSSTSNITPKSQSVSLTKEKSTLVQQSTTATPSTMLYKVQLRKEKVNKQFIFNCFGKTLNQFYSDPRDCRLFHYCTLGYTKHQLLDMKFVCDSGTYFDDEKLVCTKETPERCL